MVTVSDWDGSCTLVAVTVTRVVAFTGEGALYEFVDLPLASGPAGGPMVAPATVGAKLHVTPVLVAPFTKATRVAVCPSLKLFELVLRVTITAPCRTYAKRERNTRRRNR